MYTNAFKNALNKEVEDVNIYNDPMDCRFVRDSVKEVIHMCNVYEYLPLGYCRNSKYRHSPGVVLVVVENNGKKKWAFVPVLTFRSWLTQCGIDWVEHPTGEEYVKKYKRVLISVALSLGIDAKKLKLISDNVIKNGLRSAKTPKDVIISVFPEYNGSV